MKALWAAILELVVKIFPSIVSAAEKKPVVVETDTPAAPGAAEAENDARLAERRAREGAGGTPPPPQSPKPL